MKFHFVVVLWGDIFTDLFLRVVLPNHLSPGNLPSLGNNMDSIYKIYTQSQDAEKITRSPIFSKLSELISTKIVLIDEIYRRFLLDIDCMTLSPLNRFKALAECHTLAINAAAGDKAAFVCLPPDGVWSDGTFRKLKNIANSGKKAVMASAGGIRVVKETFVPHFLKHFYSRSHLSASITSRQLVKLALEHIHPYSRSFFWDSPRFHSGPSWLNWSVNCEGILTRGFHLHPLMTFPPEQITSLPKQIDGSNYICLAHPHIEEVYVVEDSDVAMLVDISGRRRFDEIPHNRASVFKVAYWAKYNANSFHRRFLNHKTRIHSKNLSPQWKEIENRADRVVKAIHFLLKLEPILPLLKLTGLFLPGHIASTLRKILRCIMCPQDRRIFMARLLLRFKMYRRAAYLLEEYIEASAQLDSQDKRVYNLVQQLKTQDSYEYAEDILQKLIAKNNCAWVAYLHLAEISCWFRQDRAKSREYLEKVLELSPEHEKAREYLAAMYTTRA